MVLRCRTDNSGQLSEGEEAIADTLTKIGLRPKNLGRVNDRPDEMNIHAQNEQLGSKIRRLVRRHVQATLPSQRTCPICFMMSAGGMPIFPLSAML